MHHHCERLILEGLNQQAVAEYVARQASLPRESVASIATAVYERSEGNPLFMAALVEEMVQHAHSQQQKTLPASLSPREVLPTTLPERLRLFLNGQADRLSLENQRLLEAASLIGLRFAAATVAATLGADEDDVERQCQTLTHHRQFLRVDGEREWPDGTISAQYAFHHALYRDLFVDRIPPRQRTRLHQSIAAQLEQKYGERAEEIAAELATHCVQGRMPARAVRYLRLAADTAFRRCAYRDALQLCRREAEFLTHLPATPVRIQQELACAIQLGWTLQLTQGAATAEVEQVYDRTLALCRQTTESPQLLGALQGLRGFYQVRGQLTTARELAERCVQLTHDEARPTLNSSRRWIGMRRINTCRSALLACPRMR